MIKMINHDINDNIILHKKYQQKKNKKIPIKKNKDNSKNLNLIMKILKILINITIIIIQKNLMIIII